MGRYMRGLITGGLLAAGAVMWMQRRGQRRRWLRLGARAAANAAQEGRHLIARATR
jgi:hypothetical protein